MGVRPTFSVLDDFVLLMDLKPAERTVYGLLRCNASFARNAVATHTVHVTASWFTEMTAHWEKPMPSSTARRAINGLINAGVLIRLNDPKDGSGFLLAFVADPRGRIKGPTNGFAHAQKVAKKGGVKTYYQRRDEMPGLPEVTGVRLGRKLSGELREDLKEAPADHYEDWDEPVLEAPDPESEERAVPAPRQEEAAPPRQPERPEVAELAGLLVRKCREKGLNRRGLLEGEARRVASACTDLLDKGWSPEQVSNRLASLVSDRIHSIESFLVKKSSDLGDPPAKAQENGTVMIEGQKVDLGSVSWNDVFGGVKREAEQQNSAPLPTPSGDDAKRARLAKLGRSVRRGN